MVTKKNLVAALSLLACASAMAQASLGTITNVQGVVTATQGSTATTVTTGQAITNGTRFVTASGGSVTLRLNTGCIVTLQPGQTVTVLQSMTCDQLSAAVRPVSPTAIMGQNQGPIFANPGLFNGIIIAGGAAVVIGGVREITRDDDVSGR
jgi:hypothetical protein